MLFYKKNQVYPLLSYIEENHFAEIYLIWEEKIEHPLSGTTKKKNYETEIQFIRLDLENNSIKNKKILKTIRFSKWILPEFFFTLSIEPLNVLFLYGDQQDPYGINTKIGQYYDKEFIPIPNSQVLIKNILPSPDKQYFIVIELKQEKKHNLKIYKINDNQFILLKEKEIPFFLSDERMITWDSKKRNLIFFYESNEVYEYNLETNLFRKAKEFPECIFPYTSFGYNFDTSGNQFIYDTEEKRYRIQKMNFKSFYSKKYISDSSKIQYQCF